MIRENWPLQDNSINYNLEKKLWLILATSIEDGILLNSFVADDATIQMSQAGLAPKVYFNSW